MKDERKTKKQLIQELTQLRQQLSSERCQLSSERCQLSEERDAAPEARNQDDPVRRRMEEALRASVAEWHTTFNAMSDAICLIDPQGKIQRCNRAMVELLDRPLGEILDQPYWQVTYRASQPIVGCPVARMWESGSRESASMPLGDRWFNVSVDPILDDVGQVAGAVHVMTDVTERVKAEEALRVSQRELQQTLKATTDGIWTWNLVSGQMTFSPRYYEMLGYAPDEFPATLANWMALIHPEDRADALARVNECLKEKPDAYENEFRMSTKSGDYRWIHARARVTEQDQHGWPLVLIGNHEDITARKQAEATILEERERLDTILSAQNTGLSLIDPDMTIAWVNDKTRAMFPGSDPVGQICHAFYEASETPCEGCGTWSAFESGQAVETERFNPANQRWYHIVSQPIKDAQGNVVNVLEGITDITRRKRTEETLRRSKDNLDRAQRIAHLGSWDWNVQNSTLTWSDEVYRIFRVDRDFELTHENIEAMVHPDDRRMNREKVDELLSGADFVEYGLRIVRPDGTVRHIHQSIQTSCDTPGRVSRVFGIMFDVTERKQAEQVLAEQTDQLRLLSARLADAQEAERRRMARELHDRVGQNLTALGINLNILRPHLVQAPEDVQSCLDELLALVKETTSRIRNVMADLRPPELDDYGLLAALRWHAEQVRARTGLAIAVEGEAIAPRLPSRQETALFRIAQEALTNAVKHAEATRVVMTMEASEEAVRLTITDDGVGFDPASLERAGTAPHWGLLTMQERAQAVGAHWQVESSPGRGTRVVVGMARPTGGV
jgi:two-component system sensor histidine kinase UhpB